MMDKRKIQELYNRSNELVDREDFAGAIKVFNELIASFPVPAEYRNRAMCHKELIRTSIPRPSEQQIRQWLFQARDDFSKAIELYKEMPSDLYRQADGDENVSFCYYERGEIKLMLETTYNSKMAGFKNIDTNNELEFMQFLKKAFDEDIEQIREALNDVNESIKHDRENISAYRLKGFIYDTHFDDPKTAIEQYSKAISINASPLDYFNRAWCYYQIGNKRDAISDCRRAVSLDPDIKQVTPRSANRGKREQWLEFYRECN